MALVNLRGEGEGLFAYSEQGVLLLLQMILRPVLMIIGLIAALSIFDMLYVFISQAIWGAFFGLSGGAGQAAAGSLDNVLGFYACLLVWTFLVYSLANFSFGMVNTIPNRLLGWIGDRKVQVTPAKAPEERVPARSDNLVIQGGPAGQGLPAPAAPAALAPAVQTIGSHAHNDATSRQSQKSIAGPTDKPDKGDHSKHIPKL